MLNKVMLIGHLGKDPEVRRTQDGRPVVTLSVATSERWKDKNSGEQKEATEWHRVVIFNEGLCGIAEKYLKKGSRVYIEGQNRTRKYTDPKDGIDRWTTEVVLSAFKSNLTLLDRSERALAPSEGDYGAPSGSTPSQTRGDMDDEIPF